MFAVVLVLLSFGFFLIYPDYLTLSEQEAKIDDLRFNLKKQKTLLPIHRLLSDQLEFFEKADRFSAAPSQPCDLDEMVDHIRRIVRTNGFDMKKMDLESPSLNHSKNAFNLKVEMLGMFSDLNTCLRELQALSCPVIVEMIQIQTMPEADRITLRLSSLSG